MRGVEQIPLLYDAYMAVLDRSGLRRWREWLAKGAVGRTLELGAGTGRNLPLYPPGVRLVALEPDRANVARARARAPAVPLVVAHAEALPFKDGAFDTVVSALVLCSVRDPAQALAEARRVLRPGGALRLVEHVRSRGWRGRVQDAVQPAWTWMAGGCHPNRETERAVEDAGFLVERDTRRERGTLRRLQARAPAGSLTPSAPARASRR